MNFLLRVPYAAAGAAARLAAEVVPAGDAKIFASLRARRGIRARFAAWGSSGRDPARQLVWLHAPSVGEGLQARPVIVRLRAQRPDVQIAYTFYSPSAQNFARRLGADFCDYLPFDTGADAHAALNALRPTALVFSKLDVWPSLAEHAAARGVRLGLISATLAAESTRRSGLGTMLLRDAYAALDAVGAISADDSERLQRLGVRPDRISLTGDARYDEAWERARGNEPGLTPGAPPIAQLVAPLASRRATLVAGSTWPADELPLLDAWKTVREHVPEARLLIAPHEPTRAHLQPIERWAAAAGLRAALLGDPAAPTADVVLVDRVGVLADLYALATAAYVGGGFHTAGLHSVIEPAAFGVPVLFGPRHTASRDAALLMRCGGGFSASSAPEIAVRLISLFGDPASRTKAGDQARALVESGLGAADRSAALVEDLLAV